MSVVPRERFGIDSDAGFTVFDLESEYDINPDEFISMGRATPFEGEHVFGKCLLTVYNGQTVYENLVK
jgi:dihydroorotase